MPVWVTTLLVAGIRLLKTACMESERLFNIYNKASQTGINKQIFLASKSFPGGLHLIPADCTVPAVSAEIRCPNITAKEIDIHETGKRKKHL